MRKVHKGGLFVLALALAAPGVIALRPVSAQAAVSNDDSSKTLSKEDQEKLKEHNKLRAEIKRVKYPADKAKIVAHVKGIKTDDKKWFDQTLPDKTYASADEVYSALGWETAPAK